MREFKIFDVTATISSDLAVFPGDPSFRERLIHDDGFLLKEFCFCNHTGTHIDFPRHLFREGKTSSDYSLQTLCGEALVIETESKSEILLSEIQSKDIRKNDIVFFKTRNSKISKNTYTENFVSLSQEVTQFCIDQKVKIIGIDYLSVDAVKNADLPIHRLLLSHGIFIIENLDLSEIKAGRYFANIYPLKVSNADGLPVRVSLQSAIAKEEN